MTKWVGEISYFQSDWVASRLLKRESKTICEEFDSQAEAEIWILTKQLEILKSQTENLRISIKDTSIQNK